MRPLFDLASELDVTVEYDNLAHWGVIGYYDHTSSTIWLHHGLNPILEKCTLAHELGHAHYGDEPNPNHQHHTNIEARADEYAARLLITPAAYREAEQYNPHPGALAQHLNVTVPIITAYQRQLRRRYDRIITNIILDTHG